MRVTQSTYVFVLVEIHHATIGSTGNLSRVDLIGHVDDRTAVSVATKPGGHYFRSSTFR